MNLKKIILSYFIMLSNIFKLDLKANIGTLLSYFLFLFFLVHYYWVKLDSEKFMKDAKHLYCFKNLELNHEKEDRNKKSGTWRALQKNTKGTLPFSVTAVVWERKWVLPVQGMLPVLMAAGHTPVPHPQEGFVGPYNVFAYFWNRLAQYHLSSSSPFTLWFIYMYPLWMGLKCVHAIHVLPNIGQPSAHVKRTIISDNVLCGTFASWKFSLFSKKK